MDIIFQLVAFTLNVISDLTGLSYNEVNIVVYYIFIPFTWTILLDKIFKFHYIKLSFGYIIIALLIIIKDFSKFSDWLFDQSATFLMFLGDYIIMSVIVCVFLIIIIYLLLFYFAFFYKKIIFKKTNYIDIP